MNFWTLNFHSACRLISRQYCIRDDPSIFVFSHSCKHSLSVSPRSIGPRVSLHSFFSSTLRILFRRVRSSGVVLAVRPKLRFIFFLTVFFFPRTTALRQIFQVRVSLLVTVKKSVFFCCFRI